MSVTTEELDLVALRKPAPFVKLPNGSRFQLRYLDPAGYELYKRCKEDAGSFERWSELLKAILPGATDADLDSLGLEDIWRIIGAAEAKIQLVEAALGNAGGGDGSNGKEPPPPPVPDSPPSNPTT